MGSILALIFSVGLVWATTPWWPDHVPRLPLMYKPKPAPEPEIDFHRAELNDWDVALIDATGKTMWEMRCEADPSLTKYVAIPGTLDPNPFYRQMMMAQQQQPNWEQLAQLGNLQNQQLPGLLQGLGGAFNGVVKTIKH